MGNGTFNTGYVKRVACSTKRVIKDKIYKLASNGRYFKDEEGNQFEPYTRHSHDKNKIYWVFVNESEYLEQRYDEVNQPYIPQPPTPAKVPGESIVKIKSNVTLINGADSDDLSADHLINEIKCQERQIEDLGKVKVESKHIAKKIKEHNDNIKALVKILDKK